MVFEEFFSLFKPFRPSPLSRHLLCAVAAAGNPYLHLTAKDANASFVRTFAHAVRCSQYTVPGAGVEESKGDNP